MAFCGKCGTQLDDNAKFCPSCGAAIGENTPPTASTPTPVSSSDIDQDKVMGILSYISILVLVPIFAAKDSKFARYHANQGLVLCIAEVAFAIIIAILKSIFWALAWRTGGFAIITLLNIISWLGYVAFLVLSILGIINAAKLEEKPLPVIGKITILK